MQSADRTRSKRWRSGTRRNKRHPVSHLPLCDRPDVCLVHIIKRNLPTVPPMRMMLTRCERLWVDDVRAGRRHVHIRHRDGVPISGDQSARRFNAIVGLANTIQMGGAVPMIDVTFPAAGVPRVAMMPNAPGGVVAGMDYGYPASFTVAQMGLGSAWGKAAAMDAEAARQRAMRYDVVQYGPIQSGRSH